MTPNRVPYKYCRYCGRIIPMDSVNCTYCDRNTIRTPGEKECPICREPIRQKAIKCKHCGEFLDGRPPEVQGQQVVYIDKAIIAQPDESGQVHIQGIAPDRQIEPGSAQAQGLLGQGAEPTEAPGEASGALPAAPDRKALPPGEASGLPAVVAPAPVPDVVRAAPPAVPARVPAKKRKKRKPKAAPEEMAAPVEAPAARYECPSCARYVYEGDNFCENCGRDLSIPAGRREFPGPRQRYRPADYALMVAMAAPVGLLFAPTAAVGIAAAGGVIGAWSLYKAIDSHGQLQGAGRAGVAVGAALFWMVAVAFLA